MNNQDITVLLEQYPALRAEIIKMLAIISGPKQGLYSKADAIEEQTIDVVRNIGQQTLTNWAVEQASHTSGHVEKNVKSAKKNVKKKSTGRRRLDE